MSDYTIDDLISSDTDTSSEDTGSTGAGDGGKWVTELVDKLDEKGILRPLVFGAEEAPIEDIQAREVESTPATDGGNLPEVNAQTVKGIMLKVYDSTDMVPGLEEDPRLSDLIRLVDAHPDMVDGLIEQHLGDSNS